MTYFEFQAFTRSDQGPILTHILYQLQHTHKKKKKHALKVENPGYNLYLKFVLPLSSHYTVSNTRKHILACLLLMGSCQ